ncbi:hypothetical protein V474_01880 [Novosphingobium barchaimii LL02]|uniref:Uncharacterized protein n=2 Tax=Novosphingobium barchaimii TaxID=1420591 RepID=A0A0J7XIF6_9SPHN|nr:hypothetical protein V474_01880 [Novosphingobium barchaimii LL02]
MISRLCRGVELSLRSALSCAAFALALTLSGPASAGPNSFAQKDLAGHLLAYLTEGEDLPDKQPSGVFGIPGTDILYSVRHGEAEVALHFTQGGHQSRDLPVPLPLPASATVHPWPMYVAFNAVTPENHHAYLIGVVVRASVKYGTGVASEDRLHLFRVDNPGTDQARVNALVSLPIAAKRVIPLCRSEQQKQMLNGRCDGRRTYEGFLRLDTDQQGGWPTLIFESKAAVRPAMLMDDDTLPEEPQNTAQMDERPDTICSIQRPIRYEALTGRYETQRPARYLAVPADCSEYFLPIAHPLQTLCSDNATKYLVGTTPISDGAARIATGAQVIRQTKPGEAVTEDHQPNRVTIETDPASNRITRAWCG